MSACFTFARIARIVGVSKRTVEDALVRVKNFLEDISDAVRLKDDAKLKELCRNAGRSATDLENARREMHTYWKD